MSIFTKIFARKPGGTFVGNLLRTVVGSVTKGTLGNGAMMIQPQETPEQANDRLLQGVGAGIVAGQDVAIRATGNSANTPLQSVSTGILSYFTKENLPKVIGALVVLGTLIYLLIKKK